MTAIGRSSGRNHFFWFIDGWHNLLERQYATWWSSQKSLPVPRRWWWRKRTRSNKNVAVGVLILRRQLSELQSTKPNVVGFIGFFLVKRKEYQWFNCIIQVVLRPKNSTFPAGVWIAAWSGDYSQHHCWRSRRRHLILVIVSPIWPWPAINYSVIQNVFDY